MAIYIEPVNLRQWDMFDSVVGSGHVEHFLATRDMQIGDYHLRFPLIGICTCEHS